MVHRRSRLCGLCCCGLLLLALAGMATTICAQPAAKAKRRLSPPTVKEISNAFQGKTEQPRYKIHLRLQRAEESVDRTDLIAALTDGLNRRLDKQTIDDADLQLISLYGKYSSPDAAQALKRFFQSDDARVMLVSLQAMTAADLLPPWAEILPVTEKVVYREMFALRRAVVDAAQQDASTEAVDFLIETVNRADGQLKYETAKSLTELTGQSFGGQGERWSEWWRTAREEFKPIAPSDRITASLKSVMAWDGNLPRFYRLPVYAKRVLFMIDRSGSMRAMDEHGESRIDRARRELETVIAALPAETEFDIVAFHDSVVSFSPRLLRATDETKRDALLFTRNLHAAKNTNCYDALSISLAADPNLEAIYFLSDGEPTTGGIVEPPKIVDAVSVQNQQRVTAIYTLGIDARGDHQRFLTQLAERNYGEFFSIR